MEFLPKRIIKHITGFDYNTITLQQNLYVYVNQAINQFINTKKNNSKV